MSEWELSEVGDFLRSGVLGVLTPIRVLQISSELLLSKLQYKELICDQNVLRI